MSTITAEIDVPREFVHLFLGSAHSNVKGRAEERAGSDCLRAQADVWAALEAILDQARGAEAVAA